MIREHSMSTRDSVGGTDSPFFDMTICPSYDYAYNNDALNYYGLNTTAYRSHGIYFNHNNRHSDDLRGIFNSATFTVGELLNSLTIVTRDGNIPRLHIEFNETTNSSIIGIETNYWSTLGKCYSLRLKDIVLKLGIIRLDFASRMDIYIYFGYPGQFSHPNSNTKVCIFSVFYLNPNIAEII